MAVKGTDSKNKLFEKLMKVYPDAFWEDTGKILRVPMDENGQRVEIKVTLTAAKSNLGGNEAASAFDSTPISIEEKTILTPTEEEKQNVKTLLASLGL